MCEICVACRVRVPWPLGPPLNPHEIVGPSRDQLRCAIPTRFSGGGSQERRVRRVCASELGPSDKRNCIRAEAQYLTVRTKKPCKKRSRTLLTDCGCVHVLSIGRAFGRGRSAHSPSSPPSGASTHTHARVTFSTSNPSCPQAHLRSEYLPHKPTSDHQICMHGDTDAVDIWP